jgi:hypothetical protein
MKRIITDPRELTPSLVTELLVNNGVLSEATVTSVSAEMIRATDLSITASLSVTYSPDAPEHLANKLFFKAAGQQGSANNAPVNNAPINNAEVQFYRRVGPLIQNGVILPCFAADSNTAGRYYLLLEDISQTHITNPRLDEADWFQSEYNPSIAQQIVDGFAHVHSLFWGDTHLGLTMDIRPENDLLPDEGDIRGGIYLLAG